MRLVSFHAEDGIHTGWLSEDGESPNVVDLGAGGIEEHLAAGTIPAADEQAVRRPLAEVTLAAPVRPGKILCVGYNYRGHTAAGKEQQPDPDYPDVFIKSGNVLTAPGAPVVLPSASDDVDYEGELAIVIGHRTHDVAAATALDHVAGYSVFNDVTARDWQGRSSQWALAKSFDGFGPLGPVLVTADEIDDPQALDIQVTLNGEETVRQSTRETVFPVADLVSHISRAMTLEPGDIIATGSPQKLPAARATRRPLQHGDVVTVTISSLGVLTTEFVAPATDRTPR